MCFEFEALYWAKLAEEEEKRKQADDELKAEQSTPHYPQHEDAVPA
jgi:hypothetical protein